MSGLMVWAKVKASHGGNAKFHAWDPSGGQCPQTRGRDRSNYTRTAQPVKACLTCLSHVGVA